MQRLLVDSGPLVALFDADDRWHQPVADFLKRYRGELVTSAANVTEAAWITASASDRMLAKVALAERLKLDRILTLDKKDFMVYRLKNGRPLRNVLDAEVAKR